MPTIMLPVYKGEPNAGDWLEGFDVFVIEITPQLARIYLNAMDTVAITTDKLKREGIDLFQFHCWDGNGEWFPGDYDADLVVNGEYGDECPPPLPGAEPSQTEGNVVMISEESIRWEATPKHAEIDVSTASLRRTQLERIAATTPTPAQIEADVLQRLRDAVADSKDGRRLLEMIFETAGFTPGQVDPGVKAT